MSNQMTTTENQHATAPLAGLKLTQFVKEGQSGSPVTSLLNSLVKAASPLAFTDHAYLESSEVWSNHQLMSSGGEGMDVS